MGLQSGLCLVSPTNTALASAQNLLRPRSAVLKVLCPRHPWQHKRRIPSLNPHRPGQRKSQKPLHHRLHQHRGPVAHVQQVQLMQRLHQPIDLVGRVYPSWQTRENLLSLTGILSTTHTNSLVQLSWPTQETMHRSGPLFDGRAILAHLLDSTG